MSSDKELQEGAREWRRALATRQRFQTSRRMVLKAGALASALSAGGLGALVSACSSSSNKSSTGTETSSGGNPAGDGITGSWDSTGTDPYKFGLSDADAKVPKEWQAYPWIYKYGPWRYNWNVPRWRGGEWIDPNGPPANYDLMLSGGISAQFGANKLFNRATRQGANLETNEVSGAIEPELARSVQHSSDYTSWTVELAPNVKWHNIAPVNGRAMTANDVIFSYQRYADTSVLKSILRYVDKISAPDDTHVRFDLKQPALRFDATLATPAFVIFAPEHYDKPDLFKSQVIGTGPFVLTYSKYQDHATWEANQEYWEQPPSTYYGSKNLPLISKITKQYYASTVAAKEAFFSKEVDWFQPFCTLDTTLVKEELSTVPDALVNTLLYWACCPLGVIFNYKNPLFQDIRVRQAISMATDREQVWKGGLSSGGLRGASPMPFEFGGLSFPPALSDYGPNATYNPAKAKALLKEAGHDAPLKLQLYQSSGLSADYQGALDAAVFSWKQAGVVDATVVQRDPTVFSQDKLNKSFPDIMYPVAGSLAFGITLDATMSPVFRSGSPSNPGNLSDPKLDELLDKAAVATSLDESDSLGKQIQQQMVDNVDGVWFAWLGGIQIAHSWLHGLVHSPDGCICCIAAGNAKYLWMDNTAPAGRGGTERIA